MFHVYLLRSQSNPQKTYVGFTNKKAEDRLSEHNRGLTRTTAAGMPWEIEVITSFQDKYKAEDFERYLKGGSGYAFAKRHFWSHSNPRSTKLAK